MSHPPAPTFALSPFDNPAADSILRCPDGVHFRVREAILFEASPVFAGMLSEGFSSAKAEDDRANHEGSLEYYDGKPIIAVVEGSDTIDPLLRLCYPTTDPMLADLEDIRPVLAAAIKYRMEEATALLKDAMLSYLQEQPLRVWTYACLLRLEEEARIAASALVGKELPTDAPSELHQVSTGDYYRLVKFLRCRGAVSEAFEFFERVPASEEPLKKPKKGRARGDPPELVRFKSRPYADIICRSSDGQDFRAHRIILCMASPVFHGRMSSLSPEMSASSTFASGELPVLHMDVSAAALGPVLEWCYIRPSSFEYDCLRPQLAISMMVAMRKLGMQDALERFQGMPRGPYVTASHEHPLLGYLLAAKMGFPVLAKELASKLHHDVFSYGYLHEMETTPAHIYHHLLVNRRRNAPLPSVPRVTAAVQAIKPAQREAQALAAPGTPASVAPTPAAARPASSDAEEASDTGAMIAADCHLWVQDLVRGFAEKLGKLDRSVDMWRVTPRYAEILEDSLVQKIWCCGCEPNVRAISGMQERWERGWLSRPINATSSDRHYQG